MEKDTKRKFMTIEAYKLVVYKKEDVEYKKGELLKFDKFDKNFQKLKAKEDIALEYALATHKLNNIYKKGSFYELVFSKLDSTDYPLVIDDNDQISDMKDNIGSDKKIGHITCGIYDETYQVLLLQINFNALNPRHIENYINEKIISDEYTLKLEPLIDKDYYKKVKKGYMTKFDVSMHVNQVDLTEKDTFFFKQYQQAKEFNAVNASFTMSMGKVRKDTLEEEKAKQLLDDIEENLDMIGKAKVSYKQQMESKVEVVDLVLQKLNTKVYFDIAERATLREETILNKI
ncbi:TPA: DUF6731 family protein [Staphylococcus aureus]